MTPALLFILIAAEPAFEPPPLAVGIAVGAPLGVTIAAPVRGAIRLHLAAGVATEERPRALVTFDVAYDLREVIGPVFSVGWMMPWFGLGARYAEGRAERTDQLGLRVPFGLSYFDRASGVEVFASVAFGWVLVPESDASIELAAGLRFAL